LNISGTGAGVIHDLEPALAGRTFRDRFPVLPNLEFGKEKLELACNRREIDA
jgi:hypothetical protein